MTWLPNVTPSSVVCLPKGPYFDLQAHSFLCPEGGLELEIVLFHRFFCFFHCLKQVG